MKASAIAAGLLVFLCGLVSRPGQAQSTLVNFDFNSGSSYETLAPVTATGVTAVASSTEAFNNPTGTATGSGAFTANAAGPALGTTNSSGANTRYFQFALGGSNLSSYAGYRLYWQSYRPSTGAPTLTLQYSTDGGATFSTTDVLTTAVTSAFVEHKVDLTSQSALNNKSAVIFRLLMSGASASGPLRIDNFQVQATSSLNPTPTLGSLSPGSIAAGSNGLTLTVNGTGFFGGSVVRFNGLDRPTTFVSSTRLTASIPAADVRTAGTYPVTVTNPAPGGGTSGSLSFTVTPVVRWDGGAGTSNWFDALNWDADAVPTVNDDVLLDHATITTRYTVLLGPTGAATTAATIEIRSLTVNPAAGDSILFELPATNISAAPLKLTRTGATEIALAIQPKGVVTNTSDQGEIDIPGSSAVFYIYNGGTYRHYTDQSHAALVENLAAVAGTEAGNWEFRAKLSRGGTTLSLSNRSYPNLILRGRLNTSTTYTGSGVNPLTIRGNLVVGPGVVFAPDLNSELRVAGNMTVQGTFRFQPSVVTAPKLVFNGAGPQRLSGTPLGLPTSTSYLGSGVALQINNASAQGVTLETPVTVNNVLQLTAGRLNTDATNLLTLVNQPTGGADNSYVNGPVARPASGPTTLTFPVGRPTATGGAYRPVTLSISSLSRATTFVTTQTEGGFEPTQLGDGLRRVSSTRHFTVAAEPAFGSAEVFAAAITLSFGPDDRVTNPEASSLVVAQHSGSAWSSAGRSSHTGAANGGTPVSGTLTSGPITRLGRFALGSTDAETAQNPLPVTLLRFRAERQSAGVQLNWVTATEINHDRFEVERSLAGQGFVAVATLGSPTATSTTERPYTWLDTEAPAAALAYRLRQVDADGTSRFSAVAVVPAAAGVAAVVFPNPVEETLTFHCAAGNQAYQVINALGQVVLQGAAQLGPNRVGVPQLPPGAYVLVLFTAGQPARSAFYKR